MPSLRLFSSSYGREFSFSGPKWMGSARHHMVGDFGELGDAEGVPIDWCRLGRFRPVRTYEAFMRSRRRKRRP